jgi:hypothetical protein
MGIVRAKVRLPEPQGRVESGEWRVIKSTKKREGKASRAESFEGNFLKLGGLTHH